MSINIKYNTNGLSEISVDEVCAIWQDACCIEHYLGKYILHLINRDEHTVKLGLRANINQEQAQKVIEQLGLIKVESEAFYQKFNYHTRKFIEDEINFLERKIDIELTCSEREDIDFLFSRKEVLKQALEWNH